MYGRLFPLITLVFSLFSLQGLGQAARSPYSTFGIGEPYGNATANSQGMAGLGISVPQYWYVNNQNPALLIYNRFTTFQAGMIGESRNIENDSLKERSTNGNLNYLVVAFPVKINRWTTSVGLMPLTSVNYRFQSVEPIINSDPNNDTVAYRNTELGSGGLNQFYWSNGVRINKNFSAGLKMSYVFGSIENDYSNQLLNSGQFILKEAAIEEQLYVTDFAFDLGLAFVKDSLFAGGKYRLSAGLVCSFGTSLRTKRSSLFEERATSGNVISTDTLNTFYGSFEIPASIQWGVSLSNSNKWTVGLEGSLQDWSAFKLKDLGASTDYEGLDRAWRLSLGGEYTPDAFGNNYLKRITYRAGVSYEKTPFLVESPLNSGTRNQVKDFGINFGLSLPAGRSSIDLGAKLGTRGDKRETILEERYFKIYFGLTYNDQWFIKRKFD